MPMDGGAGVGTVLSCTRPTGVSRARGPQNRGLWLQEQGKEQHIPKGGETSAVPGSGKWGCPGGADAMG